MIDRVFTYTDYDGTEKTEHFYFNMTKAETDEAHKVNPTTNCVNCGAVIDPNVDHCEYCGTSYALMGVKASPTEQVVRLKQETKLLASKIGIMQQFNDAIRAMGTYVRDY